MTSDRPPKQRRVRLWFGSHVIADYIADPATAERYVTSIERRFAGLRVTNDPISDQTGIVISGPLPNEQLWSLTP